MRKPVTASCSQYSFTKRVQYESSSLARFKYNDMCSIYHVWESRAEYQPLLDYI